MFHEELRHRNSGDIFVRVLSIRLLDAYETVKRIDIVQFTGIVAIMYGCNSYFGLTMFDSQPFPVMVAVAFLVLRIAAKKGEIKTPLLFVLFGFLIVSGILLGAYFEFSVNMLFIRGVVNYGSIVIYLIAFYEYIKHYGFPIYPLVIINLLWLIVALIQMTGFDPVSFFVAGRTSPGRGVTSLGPEPSSFGFYLFFISWIYLLATEYNPPRWLLILIFINGLSIVLVAVSALTTLFLILSAIAVGFYNIKKLFNLRNFLITVAMIIVVIFVLFTVLEGTRLERLFYKLLNSDITLVLAEDRSVNSRLAHQVLPIYILIQNWGFPAGLQSFISNVASLDPVIREFMWGNISDEKIMSWNATLLYELGVFGILIWGLIYTFLTNGTWRRLLEITMLFIFLFTSIPLSYPLIPLIFVIMYMTNKRHLRLKASLYKHRVKKSKPIVS